MKLRVLLVVLFLLTPLSPSISATPPKAGATCSKAGITKIYEGKKFTCIKSGKKLGWNKGIQIKSASTNKNSNSNGPSPTPSPLVGVQTQNSIEVRKLTIRYHRPSGDYTNWNIWIWRNSDDNSKDSLISSSGVNFEGVDSFGAFVSLTVTGMRDFKDIGFSFRLGDSIIRDIDKDRFITTFDSRGFAEIWLIQGDENVYTSRPDTSSKPLPTPSATSTPSPTSAPTPTPTPAGVIAALESFKTFPSTNTEPQKLNFHFGPNADKDFSELIKELSTGTMKLFADHYPDNRPLPVFFGDLSDLDWVIAEWAKYGYTEQYQIDDARKRSPGLVVNYWGSPQGHPTLIWTSNQLKDMPRLTKMNLISHHIVHAIQHRSARGKYEFLGCWGAEGGAELYGALVNVRIADFDYMEYRKQKISDANRNMGANLSSFTVNDWLGVIRPIEQAPCLDTSKTANLHYSVGMFLMERLVGEFGHQKVMNWWGGIRDTLDWKIAFQRAFSTDVDSWYKNSAIPYLMQVFKE